MVAAYLAADCRNCRLERLEPPALSSIAFPKSFTSLIYILHYYHAKLHLQCPLGFSNTCGGLMVAAYMAVDCSNCRLVRLGPPAHCPITLVQTSTRLIASLPCPATSSVPTWLLPYLRWSHGGCLDGSRLQKFQT
jgi:hypothetical protein